MVAGEWAISKEVARPALVNEEDFIAVQRVRATRVCADGATRSYLLAGLAQCGLCKRRMDFHWVNGRAGYRCRHGYTSSQPRPPDAPRNLYVREDVLLSRLVEQLAPDRCLSGNVDDDEPSAVAEIVARLRTDSKVIIYGKSGWTICAAG